MRFFSQVRHGVLVGAIGSALVLACVSNPKGVEISPHTSTVTPTFFQPTTTNRTSVDARGGSVAGSGNNDQSNSVNSPVGVLSQDLKTIVRWAAGAGAIVIVAGLGVLVYVVKRYGYTPSNWERKDSWNKE